jgi:hypothetical protein
MNWMISFAMRVLIVLAYLAGAAEAMDGETVGRVSLQFAGIVLTSFLFYMGLRDTIAALLSRVHRRHPRRPLSSAKG